LNTTALDPRNPTYMFITSLILSQVTIGISAEHRNINCFSYRN